MSRTRIGLTIATATLASALVAAALIPSLISAPPELHGTPLDGEIGGTFTLESAGDPAVSLDHFRGRATLLFFGYTSCPDACPVTLMKLDRVAGLLGDTAEDVQVLLITVDPDVDTPARLAEYVAGFDPSFIGLTGPRDELARIAQSYGVYAGSPEAAAPTEHSEHGAHRAAARIIPHTTHLFGLDRAGRVRVLWSPETSAEEIATDVRSLLRL